MPDTVVVPYEGRKLLARWWHGKGPRPAGQFSVRLFKEVELPFDATLKASRFTESTWGGYQPKHFPYSSNAAVEKVGPTEAGFLLTGDDITFRSQWGDEQVKGFFVQDSFTAKVLVAVLYEEPVPMVGQTQHTIGCEINVCQCPDV